MPAGSESTMTNDTTSGSTSMSTTSSEQFGSINLIVSKLGKKTFGSNFSSKQTNNFILGHELEEIRYRALDNLISKLESHVISELDLVNHKQLFIKLFEKKRKIHVRMKYL